MGQAGRGGWAAGLTSAACALLLAACGVSLSRESRYVGGVTPEGACGVAGRGTLTVAGGQFAFTPSDGVILLRGQVGADGTLAASVSMPGADHKPFVMTLAATLAGDRVAGVYATPRCRFTVALTRA